MMETPQPHADSPIVQAVAPGYQFEGPALELGGLMIDATTLTDTHIRIPLGMLNRQFRFDAGSRRTFEFLPSALRPDTLALVRAFGFNRLSCGVQSWSTETLKAVNRSQAGLDEIVTLAIHVQIDITGACFRIAIQIHMGVLQ